MPPGIAVEVKLDLLEQIAVNDGIVLAFVDFVLVDDLAELDAVAQQMEQRPAAVR